jgi:outer membrane receptor protein involved in Fe transport
VAGLDLRSRDRLDLLISTPTEYDAMPKSRWLATGLGPVTTVASAVALALLAPPGWTQAPQASTRAGGADGPTEETIEEVVVLGKNIPEPMVKTAEIASFISPEDLERQGDDTAAVALRRVTGLSLVQGKFVYVRGLGERYSSALLNGSPLPSPEPLQRVVPLDLFPSGVLSNVVVQKTYSAKYPGEFGGGLIDLQTTAVPDAPFLTAAFSFGGNSETSFEDGLTHYGSDTDWSGFDDGTRDLPGPIRDAIATGKRIDSSQFSAAELQTIGRSFVNAPVNLLQRTGSVNTDLGFDVSGGYSWETGFGSVGLIGVAGYDNGWRTRAGKQQEGIVEQGVISPRTDYDFDSTQNDVGLNGLLGVGVQWGDGNSVNLTNLYIHNTTKETRSRAGNDELAGAFVRDDYTEWFERQLFDTQLAGSHEFGAWNLQWRGSFARSTRDAPYEKGIRYRLVNGLYLHNASQEQNYTRFSEVDDEVLSGGADLSYRLEASGRQDTIISVGASYLDNDRSAVSREFRLLALDGALPFGVQQERVDFLLSDVNIAPGLLTIRETTGADGAAAYEGGLEVRAAYVQLDAEFWPLIRTSFGVRWEDAQQSVQPFNLFAGGTPPAGAPALENSYLLPTATVTWNFYEDMQLRIGASQTIGRPQFRELAPQQYVDSDNDRVYIGNPYLQDTELTNVDARYEWYFDPGEFFTAGLFYKKLDKPIESIVNEAGATVQQTYVNAPRAELYGFEAEIKKFFDLPIEATWWGEKRLFVNLNYTYTDSEVQVDQDDVVFTLGGAGLPSPAINLIRDGSRMQGQSEHIANLQLGVEDSAAQTQATLLTSYVSERISARGRPGQPDLIQDPGVIVDFVFRQGFAAFGQDMTFSLEARNLLGEDFEEFQELGGGRVDLNTYELGRSFSVGLTVRF